MIQTQINHSVGAVTIFLSSVTSYLFLMKSIKLNDIHDFLAQSS